MTGDDDERRLWFRRQVLPLEPALRVHAARLCARIACEPDDLVHDAFAKLITCTTWREIENVHAFALVTLRNLALQVARRSKIVSFQAVSDLEAFEIADDAPSADQQLAARDEMALLLRLIDDLPSKCRIVFRMCKIDGLSHAEIAVRLGLSVSTVEKHIIKGLRLCSEGLAKGAAEGAARGKNGPELNTSSGPDAQRGGGLGRAPGRRAQQ
ncbi:RNA polymerase sigma factor [Sphingomonas oryzagri]|uniref:Sigma-70 family RNA polymerase sigma factor n=1 Tax=Sphingomonas oryzagri TaxID=3042314 RepID=A0ABT6N1T1_9SPHN|nr:sigma-70 family RNA polymerase sigma factor [Sphingomonas oryzagri]MDH7639249.1 sigma-70 family RNA polymerase sigma factor [Sphingomonas oryzagri]